MIASSDNGNSNCVLYDEVFQEICQRCQIGFILDQMQTSCLQINQSEEGYFQNCLQISNFLECIRCDCGYVLEGMTNICMIAPSDLVGCEISVGENICTRPKRDYMLVQEKQQSQMQVKFAYGSHCEILDFQNGSCSQCHAGYRLDSEQKCKLIPKRIINEYFSYFSSDGELHSRSIHFIAFSQGIYPKINDCEVYQQNIMDSSQNISLVLCQQCSLGKSLNVSRTACLKQPFEQCKIVSDSDHSLCEECIDNDNFYLSKKDDNPYAQVCLPRRQLDPTTRCLEYQKHSSQCKQCQNGLELTISGCKLKQVSSKELNPREYPYLPQLNMKGRDPNCNIWTNDLVCQFCIPGMVFNTQGYCVSNYIPNCIVPDSKGGCYQCESLFYYNEISLQCIPITLFIKCRKSQGFTDKCDICIDQNNRNYPDEVCSSQKGLNCLQNIKDDDSTCMSCINMFYLNSSNECVKLTNSDNCFLTDGIHDRCLKCRKHFVLNDASECILQTTVENGICIDLLQYYFDETSQNCQRRTSQSELDFCQKFHPNENRCLQCQEGYYIFQNMCIVIENCQFSDGIFNQCYLSNQETHYINKQGQSQKTEKQCFTNKLENTCVSCFIEYEDSQKNNDGALLETKREDNTFNYQCISKKLIEDNQSKSFCSLFEKNEQTGKYICNLCINLYYLDEDMNCLPIDQKGCLVSDGRSNKCMFCEYTYFFDQETKTCQIKQLEPIPFCEKYQDNNCIECQNLFYKFKRFCTPISDPDCQESDGKNNICKKCSNRQITAQYLTLNSLETAFCAQRYQIFDYQMAYSGKKAPSTKRIQQLIVYAEPYTWNSKKQHCTLFRPFDLSCLTCESGYYLDTIALLGQVCLKNNIPNCKDQSETQCFQCDSGFFLIIGRCIQLEGCQSIEKNVCTKCSDQSILQDGKCIFLDNCEEQYQGTCLRCRAGYFVFHTRNSDGNAEGYQKSIYFQWSKQMRNEKYTSEIGSSRNNSIFHLDSCMKMPYCQESDGISDSCLRCDHGFKLIKGICVRNSKFFNNNLEDFFNPHCEDFSNELICLRCQNLFYLEDRKCVGINETIPACQESDGVSYSCNMCSFRGYELTEDGTCRYIENCEISNGLNWCILCKKSHVVNLQGRCQSIINQIDNCEVYFSLNNQETTSVKAQGCQSCLPLYYVDTSSFQQCIRLPDLQLSNCFFSEGRLLQCSVCYPGYFLKKQQMIPNETCYPSKKFIRVFNFGCQTINFETNRCYKCYERFFLGPDDFCYLRNILQKCAEFHPNEDECLVCKSGYVLKKINENYQERKICQELEETEKVIDCAEYYPNMNRCKKCIKRLQQDVVEFFLNSKDNICEDVLYLMCRTIKLIEDKIVCEQEYIENCQKYKYQESTEDNVQQCMECKDGHYLLQNLKTNNSSCQKHKVIRNCLVYSKEIPDRCEQCKNMFFLINQTGNSLNECFPISKPKNCKSNEVHTDRCSLCESGFAINQISGECVESRVRNCQIVKQSRNKADECVKCKDYFYIQDGGMECLLGFKEQNNCKVMDSKGLCVQCLEGFMVVNEGDYCMPREKSMLCQIDHCSSYDSRSMPESMICQQCLEGYFLDSAKKCKLEVEVNLNKTVIHQSNQEGVEHKKQQQTQDESGNYFLLQFAIHIMIMLLVILIVLFLVRLRMKLKRMKALRSYEKENIKKEIEEKSEVMKTGKSIEIEFINETSGSLSQISYQVN